MKTTILFLIFSFITLSTHADWVLATLLRIGATYTNEVPSDVRRMDFSNNVSDDMRDWRLAQYVIPTQYPSLVNTRYGVSQYLSESDSIEAAKSNLWIAIARQAEVTSRQFQLALLDMDVTPDMVEAALNTIEDEKLRVAGLIEWRKAQTIRRDHPLISQIAPLLGATDEILDQIFLKALEIE